MNAKSVTTIAKTNSAKLFFLLFVSIMGTAQHSFAQVPTITSFTPNSAKPGDAVTLTGTNFNTTTINNVVFFGATQATVTAATATSITATVPAGATYAPITLLNTGTSLAAYSLSNFTPTYNPAKTTITSTDFLPKQDFATGTNPRSVAIGDLDGDGKPDLVVVNQGSNTISVFRNTSSNGSINATSFATKVDFTTGTTPFLVAIGDVDGDGKPDLVVANYGANSVSILRNTATNGSITSSSFAAKVDFATGISPFAVAIGDIDGDGKPDLAVANFSANTVSIIRNTSSSGSITASSFAAKVDFATGTNPYSVAIGDLDGDNKPDLAVSNQGANSISVLRNTASTGSITASSLATKVDFATGTSPYLLALGDLDGDGKSDIAVANQGSNSISVFQNTSTSGSITTGSFAVKVDFTTGSQPYLVTIGDIDGNGKPDLVASNYASNNLSIFRNTYTSGSITTSSFATKVDFTTGTGPVVVAIGDIDGDGKSDLAVANFNSNTVSVLRNADLPPPTITSFTPASAKPGDVITITGTNFNTTTTNNIVFFGATRATVTAATATSVTVTVPVGATYTPIALLNTGTSLACYSLSNFTPTYNPFKYNITATDFLPKQDFATGSQPFSVAVGDLDGDGKPDLAVANYVSNTISVYRNIATSGTISSGSFASKVDFATGTNPYSVAIGDLDGDGKPDLAVANINSSTVSVFRNTATSGSIGTGSFATKVDFATGSAPQSVAIGDLDGDGKPDLVVANNASNTASIFRNTASSGSIGTGSFAAKVDFTTGTDPQSVAIGDLDGDGKPDLAVANYGSNTVSVYRNTATSGSITTSSFVAKVDFAAGTYPQSIAIGDLDGDGKPDLAVVNYVSNTVSLLRNTATSGSISTSSFAAKVGFATGTQPVSVAIGDLDGDGKPELAIANRVSNTASIFRNTATPGSIGIGSFASRVDFATGTYPSSVAIGDLDGDGKPDLAVANYISNTVSVLRNADILFPAITSFSPTSTKPGDAVTLTGTGFNTTSANNIVFFGATQATVSAATATSISVTVPVGATYAPITLLNTGSILSCASLANFNPIYSPAKTTITASDFLPKQDFTTGTTPQSVVLGDLDGDGKPDMIVVNYNSNTVSVFRNTSSTGSLGAGSFDSKVDFTTGTQPYAIAIGDLDGDGKPDLAVANFFSNTISVFRNTSTSGSIGSGSFAAKVDFITGSRPEAIAIGDLDGDGKPDLVVTNYLSNTVSILRNTATPGIIGIASFAPKVDFTTGTLPWSVAIGDLDGDGKPDLAVANYISNTVSILRNTATMGSINTGSFSARVDFTTGTNPLFLAIGDLDGDGKPDLAVANRGSATVSVLRNTTTTGSIGVGSFATKQDFATGLSPVSLAIGDLDGDSKPDLAVANQGSITVSVFRNTATSGSIGASSFATKVDFTTGTNPFSVAIGDLDGDGKLDLAIANSDGTSNGNFISVLRNADIPPPTITSFTPASAKPGDAVTLTGTGFNTTTTNNIVFFGATRAIVTAATTTSITASVPVSATYAPITLLNTGTGLAAYSTSNFTPTYSPAKNNITAGDFLPKQDFATGTNPFSVAVGDLDGDGKPDLVVANNSSNTVSVYRNTSTSGSIGAGSFAAKVDFATGTYPQSVAIGDLDGDGKPDLVVANGGSNSVSVIRNTATSGSIGAGSFAAKVDFATGTYPQSVVIGDLDGDGKADLAVANFNSNNVSIFRNTATSGSIGAGSFAAKEDFATGANPQSVAIGDLDGDGKPDLAVTNRSSNTASILRNTSTSGSIGTGSFATKVDFATGSAPQSVAIGDLDGDGKPDLVVANSGSNSVSVIRNTAASGSIGTGSFSAKVDFATNSGPQSVAIGDLDGDGKPDLAVANANSSNVSVFRNTATSGSITTSSFVPKVDFATGTYPISVAIGDLDGDGKPDLAVPNYSSNTVSVLRNSDIVTTWDGSTWSNGIPTASIDAIIASSNAPSSFSCKALTINSTYSLATTGITVNVNGNITNNGNGLAGTGTLNIAANSSISGNNFGVTGVLTVGSGATLTTNNLLTLKSTSIANTASIGNSAGSISGNVTVERFIPAGKRGFRFLTSTVTTSNFIKANWQEGANNTSLLYANNQNAVANYGTHITGSTTGLNGFDATLTGAASMFTYNNTSQAWGSIANTDATNLIAGNAYRLLIRGNRSFDLSTTSATNTATTLRATGTILTGSVTLSSSGSTPASLPTLAANASEFSLIGNPYASPIDWNGLTKTGLTGYYYIWDPTLATRGAYVSCFTDGTKSNGSSAVTTAIQSGQAFFVQNTSSVATRQLQITEANKTTGNTNVFRTQTGTASIGIQLYLTANININAASQDGANILFNSSYSNAVNDEDAIKFTNQDENIAVQRSNSLMSIERRNVPVNPNDTVQLKTWQLTQNSYTLRMVASNFDATMNAYLQDNYLGNETLLNLNGTTDVNFTTTAVAASMAADRFRIVFRTNGTLPVIFTNIKASQQGSGINIEWNVANEVNLSNYEVEESSDGVNFTKATTVTAANKTTYAWYDAAVNNGNNFYRIKAMDKSGSYQYSTIVNVKIGGINNVFTIVGNPIKNNNLTLQLSNVEKGNYTLTLYNSIGQQVMSKTLQHNGGSGSQTIAINSAVAKGSYQLVISNGSTSITKTVIVE